VKYRGQPAQYIVSYHALLMRAEAHPQYDGMEVHIEGKIPDMKAVATVYRKDRNHPTVVEVDYAEAVKTVKDSRTGKYRPMGPWATMPKWMLRKTAIARALKEAFPGVIGPAAVQTSDDTQPTAEVETPRPMSEEEAKEGLEALYGKETEDEKETREDTVAPEKNTVERKKATPQQKNVILKLAGETGLLEEIEKTVDRLSYDEAKGLIVELQNEKKSK